MNKRKKKDNKDIVVSLKFQPNPYFGEEFSAFVETILKCPESKKEKLIKSKINEESGNKTN
jgi:hypothetical protein